MTKCHFCEGKLKKQNVDIIRYWGKELVALHDVPALVCQQCGERYFDVKVSIRIDKRIKDALRSKASVEKIAIPIMQF